jgi:FkbM family methyltransferase
MKAFQTSHGIMYALPNDEAFVKSLARGQVFEEEIILKSVLPQITSSPGKKVVLDVGGHIGSHTLLYAKYIPDSIVYTFEPQSVLFAILEKNIQTNGLANVRLYNNAVGHECRRCTMSKMLYDGYDCDIDYNTSKKLNYGGLQLGKNGEPTTMITIDSLKLPQCDYIKIDVEGAESLVLIGASETIQKFKPIIFFEYTDKRVNEEMKTSMGIATVVPDPVDFLLQQGYTITNIDENNKIAKFLQG